MGASNNARTIPTASNDSWGLTSRSRPARAIFSWIWSMAMRPRDLDSFDSRQGAELDACFAAWPNGGPEVRYAAAWRNWQKRQTIMVPRRDWLAQFDPSLGSRSKIGCPTG